QGDAILFWRNSQREDQFPRTAAEISDLARAATLLHQFDSIDRLQRANEHSLPHPFRRRHDVEAMIHPVDQINVSMPRRTEHHSGARGLSAAGMAGGIVAQVG